MGCRFTRQHAFEYLERSLPCDQEVQIQKHLESCFNCQEHLEEARATSDALKSLPEVELPRNFLALVKENIVRERLAAEEPAAERITWLMWLRHPRGLAVAGGALALTLGWVLVQPAGNQTDHTPMVNLSSRQEAHIPLETPSALPVQEAIPQEATEEWQRAQIRRAIEQLEAETGGPIHRNRAQTVGYTREP